MTDEEYLKAAFDKWIEAKEKLKATHREKIAGIEDSIKKAEKKRANLRISIEEQEDEEERAHLSVRLKDLVASIREMQGERKRLIDEQSVTATHLDTVSKLIAWGAAARTNLETATVYEKRMVLHFLGIKVRLWRKEHTPRFEIEVGWDGLKEGYQIHFESDNDDDDPDSGNSNSGGISGREGAGVRTYSMNADSNNL